MVLEAQRLIPRLCKECKQLFECDANTAKLHGLEAGESLYRSVGCDACRGTGYRGRVGVFEVVRITARIAGLIQANAPLPDLRAAAREERTKHFQREAVNSSGSLRDDHTSYPTAAGSSQPAN